MSNMFIGLMSGTSMDGVDGVIANVTGETISVLHSVYEPYPDELRELLVAVANPQWEGSIATLMQLEHDVSCYYLAATFALLDSAGIEANAINAIGCHGQTVFHAPKEPHMTSWQLNNPSLLAAQSGINVVADWRRRDIADGGEGAPLTPIFHKALTEHLDHDVAILNLGGIANITWFSGDPAHPAIGFDVGPANMLMDVWAEKHLGQPYDKNGSWAATGDVNEALLAHFLSDPYFEAKPPKSTGREYYNRQWLETYLQAFPDVEPVDVQATLVALTVQSVKQVIEKWFSGVDALYLCGGGTFNQHVIDQFKEVLAPDIRVQTTTELGIDPMHVEAATFAYLASLTVANAAGNIPTVTGAKKRAVLGAIYHA